MAAKIKQETFLRRPRHQRNLLLKMLVEESKDRERGHYGIDAKGGQAKRPRHGQDRGHRL
jgi:hypothetical protein